MRSRVAIVGVGQVGYRPSMAEAEYKELDFEAAMRACADAGINPREDVDTFVHTQEDFWEGYSITSEYSPDQVGGALRTVCTVAGEGLQGVVNAAMHIATGVFNVALVIAHGKPSEIISMGDVRLLAYDPLYERPLEFNYLIHPALEARAFLVKNKLTREELSYVVSKNKRNAISNPRAAYPGSITREEVLMHEEVVSPLSELDVARGADGAVAVILADAKRAKKMNDNPVYIRGIGWASQTASLPLKDYAGFPHIREAAERCMKMAGIRNPRREIDFAEVEDRFSYLELQSIIAFRLYGENEIKRVVKRGLTERDGDTPVNVSGGSLGMGNILEATGLARLYEAVLQLRGEAGPMQLDEPNVAAVNSCREPPSSTCTSIILSTTP